MDCIAAVSWPSSAAARKVATERTADGPLRPYELTSLPASRKARVSARDRSARSSQVGQASCPYNAAAVGRRRTTAVSKGVDMNTCDEGYGEPRPRFNTAEHIRERATARSSGLASVRRATRGPERSAYYAAARSGKVVTAGGLAQATAVTRSRSGSGKICRPASLCEG
jgi:hypothetical protein